MSVAFKFELWSLDFLSLPLAITHLIIDLGWTMSHNKTKYPTVLNKGQFITYPETITHIKNLADYNFTWQKDPKYETCHFGRIVDFISIGPNEPRGWIYCVVKLEDVAKTVDPLTIAWHACIREWPGATPEVVETECVSPFELISTRLCECVDE